MKTLNSAYLLVFPFALIIFLRVRNSQPVKKNVTVRILSLLFSLSFINSFVYSQWNNQTSGVTTYLTSLSFINQTTGWAAGNSGKILKTTNGGTNWIQLSSGSAANFNAIQFINDNTGWVSGTPGAIVLKTTNGGINWQSYSTGENTQIFVADTNTIYGTGGGGSIIKSTNGGVNWIAQTSGTTEFLTDCYFINSSTGWACGFSGIILKTTNGGTNWISQPSGTGSEFFSIFFINPSSGWAAGGAGNMRRTTNGGANWIAMTSPSGEDHLCVYFINNSTGWVSCGNGEMITTTNGGVNWLFQTIPTTSNMNSVFFVGLTGWSTGTNGTIISTTTGGYAVGMPVLTSPANNSTGISLTPLLQWNTVPGATSYRLQLSTDSSFATVLINDSSLTATSYTVQSGLLQNNIRYFWRVRAKNSNGSGLYSDRWSFMTSLTGISQLNSQIPGAYKLYNNYPNPFNPATIIKFELPRSTFTKLIIYDISGRVVKTLISRNLSAGSYSFSFDAGGLSSGVYFYSLETSDFSDIKKMILLK